MKVKKRINNDKRDWGIIKKIGLVVLFLVVICGVSYSAVMFIRGLNEKIVESQLNDEDWLSENIKISKDKSLGKNIYAVSGPSEVSAYDMIYQEVIQDKLDVLMEDEYTFEKPLIVYNAYGTNILGVNLYFTVSEDATVSYNIHVDDKDINDFSRDLANNGDERNHSYQLIGFVPGEVNEVSLTLKDEDGEEVATKEFTSCDKRDYS